MPIRRREETGIWWIDIRTPDGQRIRRSAGTKDRKAAQEYHDRLKADLWRTVMLGEAQERTFEEAAVRFLESSLGQKDYDTKTRHIAYWREHFAGMPVSSLTTEAIMDRLPTHRTYKKRGAVKLTPATRNRYIATILRMLNLCHEWGWVSKAPKLKKAKEPSVRIRWITPGQAQALLGGITQDWMRDVSAFALATGMRAGEILNLRWKQVDIARCHAWVTHDGAKSGRARSVPLNKDAMRVIFMRRGKHANYVFTRETGLPISQVDSRMLKAACEKTGIEDFHFHDFRHTWASWHVQNGTPLFVLKELGGWETLEMVKKYAHLNPGHLAEHANVVTFWSLQQAEKEKPPREAVSSA